MGENGDLPDVSGALALVALAFFAFGPGWSSSRDSEALFGCAMGGSGAGMGTKPMAPGG